jgi:hypothetical protein
VHAEPHWQLASASASGTPGVSMTRARSTSTRGGYYLRHSDSGSESASPGVRRSPRPDAGHCGRWELRVALLLKYDL